MNRWLRVGLSAGVIIGGLVLTFLVFRLPVGESLSLIFQGSLANKVGIARTLVKSTPLILTGLGATVAWRAGMYNIGGEGQFLVGTLAGCWFAHAFSTALPAPLLMVCILLACIVGGALWAFIAGWLFIKRGVEVVISTILLNFIAVQLLDWAVSNPLQEVKKQLPQTDLLPESVMLPRLDRQLDLHAGIVIVWVAAIGVWAWIRYTKAGYRLRLVGASPSAARANRVDAKQVQIVAMMFSGGLCGLAGGIEYLGIAGQVGQGFSQQWGFLGIPVALLAGLNPLGVIPSAIFGGALFAGSENLGRFTQAGATLVYVIQAIVVLGLVAVNRFASKRNEVPA